MKAITLRQPWPWALLAGGCDTITMPGPVLEGYRGEVMIHAGQHLSADFERVAGLSTDPVPRDMGTPAAPVPSAMGGFVGFVTVHSTHPATACKGICSEWAGGTGFHSRVGSPRTLPRRIPGFGQTGLFTPAPAVLKLARVS